MRFLVAIEFHHAPMGEYHYRAMNQYEDAVAYIMRFPNCKQSVCYDFEEKRVRMHGGSGSYNVSHEDMELILTKMLLTEA